MAAPALLTSTSIDPSRASTVPIIAAAAAAGEIGGNAEAFGYRPQGPVDWTGTRTDRDPGALGCEGLGTGKTDTLGAAGNQHDLAV